MADESFPADSVHHDAFVINLTDRARDHADWISIVKFGIEGLVESPGLLVEIITRRAQLEVSENPKPGRCVAGEVRRLFGELSLGITWPVD